MTYETRTTKVTVLPKGEALYHEGATEIAIVDEAGGEFLEVSQYCEDHEGKVRIDIYEWPTLKAAIERMIKECRGEIPIAHKTNQPTRNYTRSRRSVK